MGLREILEFLTGDGRCLSVAERTTGKRIKVVEKIIDVWKKSDVWNHKKFRILLLLEALLLLAGIAGLFPGNRIVADENTMEIVLEGGEYLAEKQGYYIDGSYGYNGVFLTARPGKLRPGVYNLRIYFEADENLETNFGIESKSGIFRNLLSNFVTVYGGTGEQTCQFYVCGTDDSAKITVNYSGGEAFLVNGIEVIHTNAGSRILICLALLGSAFVNTLIMLYCYGKRYPVPLEKKLVWFGIPGLAILASVPLFVDYMIVGEEAAFHWLRIEALAQSLAQGAIPARVEAMWLYGHGYANSIFYCDTFLTFPALLRLIGFDMNIAYNTYVFAVNLATALIAYLCFRGCFKDSRVGMFGSMLYTLAPFRIYNMYNRVAVGEYTAMMFFPVLMYGFYRIFTDDPKEKKYKRNWMILTLGYSGIIQSHVLSCEIAGGFTIILCLILIKKVFCRQTFWELLKTVFGTILLNFWFLVPFLDMMVSGQYYYSRKSGSMIQNRGILPANIFDTMQAAGSSSNFDIRGLLDTEPIGIGIAILLGIGAFLLIRAFQWDKRDKKQDQAAIVAFSVGIFALAASTCYFPWNAVQSWNGVAGMLVSMLQFPTRLINVPVICLSFVACAGAALILKSGDRFWKNTYFVILCGTALVFSLYQTNDILMKKGEIIRLYSAENIGHSIIVQGEYLPEGAQFDFSYHGAVPSAGVEVLSFEKSNLDTVTQVHVDSGEGEYWLELPMLCYKGYRAQDMDTGERFEIQAGTNQEVRVSLPAGYSGNLHVWYAGMWYWRVAEGVSILFFILIFYVELRQKRINFNFSGKYKE